MPSSDLVAEASPGSKPLSNWRRPIIWSLGASVSVVLLAGVFHRPLLRGVARLWQVDQTAGPADAIVVSTGASPEQFQQALSWWREGRAPRLVLTRSETKPTDRAGITVSMVEQRRHQLDAAGVPEVARVFIGEELRLLSQEVPVVRAWAGSNGVKRILMPTDPFATRRVNWLARRVLSPAGIETTVVSVATPHYSVSEWWRSKEGLLAMENEWALMAYYWWNH